LLVVGCLLPLLLFAAAVVEQLSRKERSTAEQRLLMAARGVAAGVDSELAGTVRALQVLAQSDALDRGDLRTFHAQAGHAAGTQPTWMTVLLLQPNGHQLVNSSVAFGTPLSNANEPQSLERLLTLRRPTVGDLAIGKRGRRFAFPVRIPVIRQNQLRYVLTAVIEPKSLEDVLVTSASTEGEWTRTLVDSRGVVLSRSRNPEKFLGKQATASYWERINSGKEGIFPSTTLDGVQVRTGFSRLSVAPWTASVSVPVDVLQAPARRAMLMVIGIGSGLLFISGLGAFLLSRRIAFAMASAATAAQLLVKGEQAHVRHGGIEEVAALGEALAASSALLAQHENERNQHLARAEAARDEAEKARDEAENANRLKDFFLAALSHEIRSPLTPILGLASLLRTQQVDETTRIYALETIERNTHALDRLVDDLLDMSRLKTGKLSLVLEKLELAAVVSSTILAIGPAVEKKAIDLRVAVNAPGVVMGDSVRLQQILFNLLSNAVKFTPENGTVEICLDEERDRERDKESTQDAEQAASGDDWAILQVRDTGIGIDEDFLPYIFDRFRQADGSSTRKFGGLGLGLAIVRDLVELHGGTIEARSGGEGQGALFEVRLPLAKMGAAETIEAEVTQDDAVLRAPLPIS
jgi:signal transduction histidine kinase